MLRRVRFEEWMAAAFALLYLAAATSGIVELRFLSYFTAMGLKVLAVLAVLALVRSLWRGRKGGDRGVALAKRSAIEVAGFVRDWIPWVVLVSVYENSLLLTGSRARVYDLAMFRLDEMLFGGHADLWLQRTITGARTAWIALFYDLLYLYTVGIGGLLYLLGRHGAFRRYLVSFLAAGYLGYALYFVFPVVGPYYYFDELYTVSWAGVHDESREAALRHAGATRPGHVFFDVARRISSKESYDGTIPRNCFPSLHTAWGILIGLAAWRASKPLFAILAVPLALMILGTVYLRFHYAIDLVAGAMLAWLVDSASPWLVRIGAEPGPASAASATTA